MMIMKKEMIIIRWRSLQQMIISWPGLRQAGAQGAQGATGWCTRCFFNLAKVGRRRPRCITTSC